MIQRDETSKNADPANPLGRGHDAGFATRLRDATKTVHRDAERSGFIADLIRGRATRQDYAVYLRNLLPVYASLEAGLQAALETGLQASEQPDALLAAFADPTLRRLPALLADLESIAGAGWAASCPLLSEAEVYARAIAQADAPGLVAHAYARYLGDLSGGQILRPLLTRSLGLGEEALGLYAFPGLADIEAAKRAMRDALDLVPAEGETADAIVEEAIAAFHHNIALSKALSASLAAAPHAVPA